MSAVIERQPEVFESIDYFDHRTVTSTTKRWIFFPGDLILPDRKSELSWLEVGGEETPCPCLQKYGRGFVPRGRAAILEMGGEPIPMRHLGDLQAVAWRGLPLNDHVVKHNFGYIPVYPGDGLQVLRRYVWRDGKKGMDEITALAGKEWEEAHNATNTGVLDVVEKAQFGDGMSKTLKGLEDQIRFAKVDDSRIDYGKMRDEELKLCEDFRNWGRRKVAIEHGLLKTGHVGEWQGGWSYAYSPVCELIIDQLELKRQDQPIQEMSEMVSQILSNQKPVSTGMTAADLELFERKMDERLAAARAADAQRIAELEARLASETFACDGCGQECASKAGKLAHERHCPACKPEE